MNIAAAILASLVLYMTIQKPVLKTRVITIKDVGCPGQSSCSKNQTGCGTQQKEQPGKEDPNNCCEDSICNPFGPCCGFLAMEKIVLSRLSKLVETKKRIPANEDGLSSYAADSWKPPELLYFTYRNIILKK